MMKKRVSIWGATGSIGTQTLDVLNQSPDLFQLETLTAHTNAQALFELSRKHNPVRVILTGTVDKRLWGKKFEQIGIPVLFGKQALLDEAGSACIDITVNALVGSAGLEATLLALKAGSDIALANKEALVMAGELVMETANKSGARLLPVDSEHSAVFQCLQGEAFESAERLILTASGGPFRTASMEELKGVTKDQALAHPNWSMGPKVTIDSATLLNKGLEVIEARWLFDIPPEKIDVVIHPQSIIHSMVVFSDGSIKAQMGLPDMRIPIAYALAWPNRLKGNFGKMDFANSWQLDFEPPDISRFPALNLAFSALKTGGTAPAVLNAADEMAVQAFLNEEIKFLDIPALLDSALQSVQTEKTDCLETVLEADRKTREIINTALMPKLKGKG